MIDNAVFDELMLDSALISTQQLAVECTKLAPQLRLSQAIEFHFLAKQQEHIEWAVQSIQSSPFSSMLIDSQKCRRFEDNPILTSVSPFNFEFLRCPIESTMFADTRWSSFCFRIQQAAALVGLGKRFAQGIVATMEELVSNAIEHSQCPSSAIVAYQSTDSFFELVIADAGEGLLASLRRAAEFSGLNSSDEAIELALRENVSRFGSGAGRGNGFRQVLRNLEFAGCSMRFRSGDAVLHMNHAELRNQMSVATNYAGFLMALSAFSSDFG